MTALVADPLRTAILDAALAAFTLEPVNRVKVAGIADAAHVSVGAIYHHFGDKEGLHAAVVERLMEGLVEGRIRPVLRSDKPPSEKLIDATCAYVRFFESEPDNFRLLAEVQHDAAQSENALRFRRSTMRMVTSLLAETIDVARAGQAAGELRTAPPGEQVLLIWASIYGLCALSQRFPSPVEGAAGRPNLEEVAVGLVHLALMAD